MLNRPSIDVFKRQFYDEFHRLHPPSSGVAPALEDAPEEVKTLWGQIAKVAYHITPPTVLRPQLPSREDLARTLDPFAFKSALGTIDYFLNHYPEDSVWLRFAAAGHALTRIMEAYEKADETLAKLTDATAGLPVPSYHDLHITTEDMARTSIFNLPFNVFVQCTRTGGWEVWHKPDRYQPEKLLAGEYAGAGQGMILDVAGLVIADSINRKDLDSQNEA